MEQVGRVSAASVQKGTGRNWSQWISLLNKQGAQNWTHKEIVAFLKKKYKLGPWWQQGVTTGYEIAIGRRIEGQNQKGQYSVTATKSLLVNHKKVWKWLTSTAGLSVWLRPLGALTFKPKQVFEAEGGVHGEVRTMKAGSRFRLAWYDPDYDKATFVQLLVVPKPKDKCIVAINHDNLPNTRMRNQMREQWKQALGLLAQAMSEGK